MDWFLILQIVLIIVLIIVTMLFNFLIDAVLGLERVPPWFLWVAIVLQIPAACAAAHLIYLKL